MSLSCKHCGFNGKLSASFKPNRGKEPLHGFNRFWNWKRQLFFSLWILGGVIGFVWFFSGLSNGVLRTKDEAVDLYQKDRAWILLEHFNVSKDQFHALASLFYESDQEV
ncbi:histidine kinase [Sarracenia purpurea var. burkii]